MSDKKEETMDKEQEICKFLREFQKGKERAVFSCELERLFSLTGRSLRRIISSLRQEGYPSVTTVYAAYSARERSEETAYDLIVINAPLIDENGAYVSTISEGDILRYIKNAAGFDIAIAENTLLDEVLDETLPNEREALLARARSLAHRTCQIQH